MTSVQVPLPSTNGDDLNRVRICVRGLPCLRARYADHARVRSCVLDRGRDGDDLDDVDDGLRVRADGHGRERARIHACVHACVHARVHARVLCEIAFSRHA